MVETMAALKDELEVVSTVAMMAVTMAATMAVSTADSMADKMADLTAAKWVVEKAATMADLRAA